MPLLSREMGMYIIMLIRLIVCIILVSIFISDMSLHIVTSNEDAYALEEEAQSESASNTIKSVTTVEAYKLIQDNSDNPEFLILDVRTPAEYADGHIDHALNIDMLEPTFRDSLVGQDRNKTYIVYCRSGNRSSKAVDMMDELGFQKVYNMTGGIVGWENKQYPVVK